MLFPYIDCYAIDIPNSKKSSECVIRIDEDNQMLLVDVKKAIEDFKKLKEEVLVISDAVIEKMLNIDGEVFGGAKIEIVSDDLMLKKLWTQYVVSLAQNVRS